MYSNDYQELYHYGVKGMEWGKNKFKKDNYYSKTSGKTYKTERFYNPNGKSSVGYSAYDRGVKTTAYKVDVGSRSATNSSSRQRELNAKAASYRQARTQQNRVEAKTPNAPKGGTHSIGKYLNNESRKSFNVASRDAIRSNNQTLKNNAHAAAGGNTSKTTITGKGAIPMYKAQNNYSTATGKARTSDSNLEPMAKQSSVSKAIAPAKYTAATYAYQANKVYNQAVSTISSETKRIGKEAVDAATKLYNSAKSAASEWISKGKALWNSWFGGSKKSSSPTYGKGHGSKKAVAHK